ncbi:MAG: MarR family winged helix-turn-helix transcriptional regulator [Brachymonas sp.]
MGPTVDRLVVSVFQLNGALLEAGEQITAPLGLTSARWQVMGALDFAEGALTVPQIAHAMGLSRQAVLKQIKLLASDSLVQSQSNQAHKRSELWSVTPAGRAKYDGVMAAQRRLVAEWRKGLTLAELAECTRVLEIFSRSIQRASESTPKATPRTSPSTHQRKATS